MSRWLRINEDCIDNPKILKLPEALRWQWVALLCVASKNDGVLPPLDDVALCLRVPEAKAAEFITKLVKAKLIGQGNSPYLLSLYVNHLTRRIITEVFPVMPITMEKIDDYIYKTYRLLTSVIVEQSIHLDELAPCLLTEVLAEKRGEITNLWRGKTSDHLDVILTGLPELSKTKADFMNATKLDPMRDFCPLREIPQFEDQSILSYREQRASVSLGVKAVNQ